MGSTALAQNLRTYRRRAGLTQAGLAEKTGVSRRMIAAIEAGGANVSLQTLERMAPTLQVSVPDLLIPRDETDAETARTTVAWRTPAGSYAELSAVASRTSAVEVWDCLLRPGEAYEGSPDAPGTIEVVWLAAGSLRLALPGETLDFSAPATRRFGTNQPYRLSNPAPDRDARFVRVILSPPKPLT